MRYKLRSSSKAGRGGAGGGSQAEEQQQQQSRQPSPPASGPPAAEGEGPSSTAASEDLGGPAAKRPRLPHRRRKKSAHHHVAGGAVDAGYETVAREEEEEFKSDCTILDLPQEMLRHIGKFLDSRSFLSLLTTCKWIYNLLKDVDLFWKEICTREELANYQCLLSDDCNESAITKVGWQGRRMRVTPPEDYTYWRRVFTRGLQMRRNIWQSNYEGWRMYANSNVPVVKLTPDLDLNEVKKQMGEFPKLSENDDLKIDWDERHLVVFHFFRGEGESCTIRVWDIFEEPKFLYSVDRGLESITDKVSVVNGHVVIVPSWPLEAHAIVMALDIRNNMQEVGKFIFPDQERQLQLDELWEHTQLRVVKNEALVVCRCPDWHLIVVSLPSCQPLYEVHLGDVSTQYECQQIRSYKHTAMIIFARKTNDASNILVTVDIAGADTKVRSSHVCSDVADVALFTEPEEIYIMKRSGDVVAYDANLCRETPKIKNDEHMVPILPHNAVSGGTDGHNGGGANGANNAPAPPAGVVGLHEYQLFVNRKEQICVMQSASEVPQGRHIKVYTYSERRLYTVNLDLCRYGMSRDESICIYTNGAFLAAADSKRFALFNVRSGRYLGAIQIPAHLERTKGKEEKDCMFEQTGLSLFLFDEDKLIAVHDYERSFPAVLDIYKFW